MRMIAAGLLMAVASAQERAAPPHPNVVVVMTDDQGCGDFGFAGNPVIRTPHLDALAAASARLANFYVSPVCTPTRASLMTGRHAQRTRAFDTYIGRAMMEPDEVTVAEVLRAAGYATGIFGKWHLGDCHPLRAIDQGFEHALVLRGGGIGQPSDPPGGERKYTDPVLFEDGVRCEAKGYCTDVFFTSALAWMKVQRDAGRPFFCYLPTNAPHGPFHDVPEDLRARYLADGLGPERFPATPGHAAPAQYDVDRLARIYAMLENVDANVGRLISGLRALGCLDDTLILFLCDNGPEGRRWLGGYRGAKASVYEGGIRSPLLAHWPRRLRAGTVADRIAAHIDLMPTILEACGVPLPGGVALDGRSVLPLLEGRTEGWSERTLVIQAHRGDVPVEFHNVAVRTQRWKLVNASGFDREVAVVEPRFELFDMAADPFETEDVATAHPDVVARLRTDYERHWVSIEATRPDAFAPPRIFVGTDAEPTTTLTRQDWRRVDGERGWGGRGEWRIDVRRAGTYAVTLRLPGRRQAEAGEFTCGDVRRAVAVPRGAATVAFEVDLPAGPAAVRTVLRDAEGDYGAHQMDLVRLR